MGDFLWPTMLTTDFLSFKKAFNRVWHVAFWATVEKHNIRTNLIRVIKNLYDKATSAVLFNSSMGDWFQTTVGVRLGCLRDIREEFPVIAERTVYTDDEFTNKDTREIEKNAF